MRKFRFALVATLTAFALGAPVAKAQDTLFVAPLSGAEEVPVRATIATGQATIEWDGTGLNYTLTLHNIRNVVAAHIHLGQPGVNGPIVVTLFGATAPGSSFVGTTGQTAGRATALEGPLAGQPLSALVAQLTAGNAYVNVHTNDAVPPADTGPGDFPGGEIRGQLRNAGTGTDAQPVSAFFAAITGLDEVPQRATPATGAFTMWSNGVTLSYELRIFNLSNPIAAHIHLGPPGVNGPIVLSLATQTPFTGVFTGVLATASSVSPPLEGPLAGQPLSVLLAQIAAGNAYVNVHTNDFVNPPNTGPGDFPGGEIRGQVVQTASTSGAVAQGGRRGRGR